MSETTTSTTPPVIGQPWPEQGGIFIGSRLIDGDIHHRIIPGGPEFDIPASHNNAAERIAAKGAINGHNDWFHGDPKDVMLAYINVPHLFPSKGIESVQITSKPYGEYYAWAVVFEHGDVDCHYRLNEFRVRPFRSIIASSI
ncbi:DUF1566 domain-containing protein [Pseudothauera rhizosphaerae]|uniref:DUF1566 domain-containing protein n=1 Tax=Pseudothauera rhizosphaerae TaxID=2565932 RepID=A0A4S4AGM0_9RHOO|nr:DUF1566 domain-containing protein [Pseudothauera rhizosphaerae]THF58037.1 DUF1566 domain-containing protein [Pseudothauera rhizosphaerae]